MSALTRWRALGTTAELVVEDRSRLLVARIAVERELATIDRACSRFRADSELSRLNAAAGTGPQRVGPLLLEAVAVAIGAAERTAGAVDPTVGHAVAAIGYDRDLALVAADGPALVARPAPGTSGITVDRDRDHGHEHERGHGLDRHHGHNDNRDRGGGSIDLPAGVALDLGATAKALAADRAAAAALRAVHGGGVLVSLGGDVAVAGPAPRGGWAVGIADDHRERRPEHVVAVDRGGLATSGLGVRRWRRGGRDVHHVVDPRSGEPVAPVWRTVSVAAPDCVAANTWSTAALVLGDAAPEALRVAGVAARLVADDGSVTRVGGWPADRVWAEAA